MSTLQLALAGAGAFGERYAEALQGLPGVRVRWLCDPNAERLAAVATRFGIDRTGGDVREALSDPQVGGVIVVTPEAAHREVAVAALEAGKHVLVEKPLATTMEDGHAMLEAARRADRLLMTAFLLRFDYRYARLHQKLPSVGKVHNVYAYRNFDRNLFALYSRTHSFLENAIHDLDLILWCVPSRVTAAHGFCRNTQDREHPDVNWGVLEFADGTLAVVQTSWLYPPQEAATLQWNAGLQVMGERGVLEVRFDSDGFRANTEVDGHAVLDQTGWAVIHGEQRGAFGAMLRHCVACMKGEATYCGTSPLEALESMRIAGMLIHSAEQGRGGNA